MILVWSETIGAELKKELWVVSLDKFVSVGEGI